MEYFRKHTRGESESDATADSHRTWVVAMSSISGVSAPAGAAQAMGFVPARVRSPWSGRWVRGTVVRLQGEPVAIVADRSRP
jgi:hypothetical protein